MAGLSCRAGYATAYKSFSLLTYKCLYMCKMYYARSVVLDPMWILSFGISMCYVRQRIADMFYKLRQLNFVKMEGMSKETALDTFNSRLTCKIDCK